MSSPRHSSVLELRRSVEPHSFEDTRVRSEAVPRHLAACALARAARIALAPFAALAAAAAGLVFVVLLPICGIASLAEGFARACWREVLRALPRRRRGALSQD